LKIKKQTKNKAKNKKKENNEKNYLEKVKRMNIEKIRRNVQYRVPIMY
jgi:hypothetical protein